MGIQLGFQREERRLKLLPVDAPPFDRPIREVKNSRGFALWIYIFAAAMIYEKVDVIDDVLWKLRKVEAISRGRVIGRRTYEDHPPVECPLDDNIEVWPRSQEYGDGVARHGLLIKPRRQRAQAAGSRVDRQDHGKGRPGRLLCDPRLDRGAVQNRYVPQHVHVSDHDAGIGERSVLDLVHLADRTLGRAEQAISDVSLEKDEMPLPKRVERLVHLGIGPVFRIVEAVETGGVVNDVHAGNTFERI